MNPLTRAACSPPLCCCCLSPCCPPPRTAGADPMAASLLIECRGSTEEDLRSRIEEVQAALRKSGLPFGAKAAGAGGREFLQGVG